MFLFEIYIFFSKFLFKESKKDIIKQPHTTILTIYTNTTINFRLIYSNIKNPQSAVMQTLGI